MVYPRTLVISHNVFSKSGNMGKTMADLLSCIPSENLAQLFFHAEIPTMDVCKRYFRITDQDVLQSIFTRRAKYHVFQENDIHTDMNESRVDYGMTAKAYQFARRRTPAIYCLRNMMWKIGRWESSELEAWIREFNPKIIFFASGDYAFAYRIVFRIQQKYRIPVVWWCCDDHYLGRESGSWFNRLIHKNLMKWVKKLSDCTAEVIVISDKMKRDYTDLFKQPIHVIRISAQKNIMETTLDQRKGIVYSGGLGVHRYTSLIQLGQVLRKAKIKGFEVIDVFSGEQNPTILSQMTVENGIRFHGFAAAEQIPEILGNAKFLVHLEAFDEVSKARTRYSLSTKIGEYLQSGACIIAYGPEDVSSIEYLSNGKAAAILNEAEELPELINMISSDETLYRGYVTNAKKLAEKYHNKQQNNKKLHEILLNAVQSNF